MLIKLIREPAVESGAILGRVFVDGSFFAHSLENNLYKFPAGSYDLTGKYSPTFKKNKVYIDVPNRSNIMFHGGNSVDSTKGCVIIAANRDGERVSGDKSDELFNIVDCAGRNGEAVGLVVRNDYKKYIVFACVLGALGALFYLTKG
ncbi:MAG: hypothetical protein J5594_05705 [Elusimicrobiaceae bacterium]|nr:hypothetical protein [Elusimicrobiaceae bacterium]MBR4151743.1 hypothetical protein [Selenomonadaceae bacterium]